MSLRLVAGIVVGVVALLSEPALADPKPATAAGARAQPGPLSQLEVALARVALEASTTKQKLAAAHNRHLSVADFQSVVDTSRQRLDAAIAEYQALLSSVKPDPSVHRIRTSGGITIDLVED